MTEVAETAAAAAATVVKGGATSKAAAQRRGKAAKRKGKVVAKRGSKASAKKGSKAVRRRGGDGVERAGAMEQFRLLLARSWRQVNRAKFANATRVSGGREGGKKERCFRLVFVGSAGCASPCHLVCGRARGVQGRGGRGELGWACLWVRVFDTVQLRNERAVAREATGRERERKTTEWVLPYNHLEFHNHGTFINATCSRKESETPKGMDTMQEVVLYSDDGRPI